MTLLGLAVLYCCSWLDHLPSSYSVYTAKIIAECSLRTLAQHVERDFEQKWLEIYDKYSSDALESLNFRPSHLRRFGGECGIAQD